LSTLQILLLLLEVHRDLDSLADLPGSGLALETLHFSNGRDGLRLGSHLELVAVHLIHSLTWIILKSGFEKLLLVDLATEEIIHFPLIILLIFELEFPWWDIDAGVPILAFDSVLKVDGIPPLTISLLFIIKQLFIILVVLPPFFKHIFPFFLGFFVIRGVLGQLVVGD
jgi:hypothetical protein